MGFMVFERQDVLGYLTLEQQVLLEDLRQAIQKGRAEDNKPAVTWLVAGVTGDAGGAQNGNTSRNYSNGSDKTTG